DQIRHAHVLVVQLEGVAIVALVLSEGFAVIAQHDPDRVSIESARLEPAAERSQSGIAVVNRVAISPEFVAIGERAAVARFIRMVAGDRKVGYEERSDGGPSVSPAQDASDR